MNPRIIEILSSLQCLRKEQKLLDSEISEATKLYDVQSEETDIRHKDYMTSTKRLLDNPSPSVIGSYKKAKAYYEQSAEKRSAMRLRISGLEDKQKENLMQLVVLNEELGTLIDAGEFR